MSASFQFKVTSKTPPVVEVSSVGLYVRFSKVKVDQTIVRCDWPHVAIDLAEDGSVIGLECIPLPEQMTLGKLAKTAGLKLPKMNVSDLRVSAAPAPDRGQQPTAASR